VTTGGKAIRPFATRTEELWQVGDWLSRVGGRPVASESTGGYWKPVGNMLDSRLTGVLVKARPRKAVPGRKADGRDWEGLADW